MAAEILEEPHPESLIKELWYVYPALCGNAAEAGRRMYGGDWKVPDLPAAPRKTDGEPKPS